MEVDMIRNPGKDFRIGDQVAWFDGISANKPVIKFMKVVSLEYPVEGKLLVVCDTEGINPSRLASLTSYPCWYAGVTSGGGMVFEFTNPWFLTEKEVARIQAEANGPTEKLCESIKSVGVPNDQQRQHMSAVLRWIDFWRSEEGQTLRFPDS